MYGRFVNQLTQLSGGAASLSIVSSIVQRMCQQRGSRGLVNNWAGILGSRYLNLPQRQSTFWPQTVSLLHHANSKEKTLTAATKCQAAVYNDHMWLLCLLIVQIVHMHYKVYRGEGEGHCWEGFFVKIKVSGDVLLFADQLSNQRMLNNPPCGAISPHRGSQRQARK